LKAFNSLGARVTFACRFCPNISISEIADLGLQPIANNFRLPSQNEREYYFQLLVGFCPNCFLVQLVEQPAPEQMFHGEYKFFSQTSQKMIKHFEETSKALFQEFASGSDNSGVLEIGSNDGIFLQNLVNDAKRLVGIDPSTNVSKVAKNKGIEIVDDFFGSNSSLSVLDRFGKFDLVFAANVICHIPDIRDLMIGIKNVLKSGGTFVFEEPYLGDMVSNNSYDQIYDEHVYIFSANAIKIVAHEFDLTLFRCEKLWTHGGSMRYFLSANKSITVEESVKETIQDEFRLGLTNSNTLQLSGTNFLAQAQALKQLLEEFKLSKKKIVGYGATSKSTTILNYAQIGPELISYIADTTPQKQGRLSPGMSIPIVSFDFFYADQPDYVLLFAWNHKQEIFEKENLKGNKFKWIIPFPMPSIVEL
jgi:methylation protein EvaC